eukprot:GHVS01054592.1.p1 GENE.GHVS01054592.1~~GHVS01054592.1.p1  ORF type:complete len:557 (+),score=121.69 GHVS01054592.1:362-2032(+)
MASVPCSSIGSPTKPGQPGASTAPGTPAGSQFGITPFESEYSSFESTPRCLSPALASAPPAFAALPPTKYLFTDSVVRLIGAPIATGQPLGGVEEGPNAVRKGGIQATVEFLGWQFEDAGDLVLVPPESTVNKTVGKETEKEKEEDQEGGKKSSAAKKPFVAQTLTPPTPGFSTAEDEFTTTDASGKERLKNKSHTRPIHEVYYSRKKIKNCSSIGFACCQIFCAVREAALAKRFCLTVGGDHSLATGTITAMLSAYPNLAVIWVDAHGDSNTPDSSPSGHYHGMPAAHVLGWFRKRAKGFHWREKRFWESREEEDKKTDEEDKKTDEEDKMLLSGSNGGGDGGGDGMVAAGDATADVFTLDEARLAFIGLRDLDPLESRMIGASKVTSYTMKHIDQLGIGEVVARSLDVIDPDQNRPLYLSLDIDSCDPYIAPGTGTKARGGLTYREVHYICETLAESRRLVGMDLVEINPGLDRLQGDCTGGERTKTWGGGGTGTDAATTPDESTEKLVEGGPTSEENAEDEMHGDQLPIRRGTGDTVRLGIELVASSIGKSIM